MRSHTAVEPVTVFKVLASCKWHPMAETSVPCLHRQLEVKGNTAVEFGVVPEAQSHTPDALHKQLAVPGDETARPVGFCSQITAGSTLPFRVSSSAFAATLDCPSTAALLVASCPVAICCLICAAAVTPAAAAIWRLRCRTAPCTAAWRGADVNHFGCLACFEASSDIGVDLHLQASVMRGTIVEVLAWRGRVEFLLTNKPMAREMHWVNNQAVARTYRCASCFLYLV